MTAEIAVLNRHAVAMAADSAVTVGPTGSQKVYNSVNKLFMLSKYAPVGVMIYGSAHLTEMPWETCIKAFRRQLGTTRLPHLEDYWQQFLKFIQSASSMFPSGHQEQQVKTAARSIFTSILSSLKRAVDERTASGPVTVFQLRSLLRKAIDAEVDRWTNAQRLPGRTDAYGRRIASTWSAIIASAIDDIFNNLPMSTTTRRKLEQLPGIMFTRDRFPDSASGLVIAGFGEEDYFPSLVSFDIEGIVLQKLKYRQRTSHSVAIGDDACIAPFAQGEMVYLFMEGIDPNFRRLIDTAMNGFLTALPNAVASALPLTPARQRITRRKLEVLSSKLAADFGALLTKYAVDRHVTPVINSVAILPKEELAAMAESLVHLTSLKRRVTMDAETVGGPIDVAVISKGDGFIWIKRKHYFDQVTNPHFLANYYR